MQVSATRPPLRVAIVGAGAMGTNHLRVLRDFDESVVTVVGVAESFPETLARAERIFHVPGFADYGEMIERTAPDLVVVVTPTVTHFEVATFALQRGCHTLVEKPIARTVDEALALVELSQAKGVVFAIGHVERFNPAVRRLKQLLEEQTLGQIYQLHARRLGPFPPRIRDVGVTLDLATHDLDVTPSVPVRPASGQARWGAQRPPAWDAADQDEVEAQQDELVSANPLEWWADSEAADDVRFATGSMISIDATATGSQVIPEALQGLEPPARKRTTQGAQSSQGREVPPARGGPPAQLSHAAPWQSGRSDSARRAAEDLRAQRDPAAPLERDDTGYVPVWRVSTARMPAIVARAETMVAIIRRLMRSSGLYAVAALGTPAVSLALTPFLAHNMAESDYGLLAVLNTSISLFAGLTQLGLGPAFFRAYNYDFTSESERRSVMATSPLLMLALSGVFLAVTLPLAPLLAGLLAPGGGLAVETDVMIACLVIAFQNLSVPGFAWLRAGDRALAFSLVSMTNVLVTLGASIVLVGVLRWGVAGAMIANGAGYAAAVLGTLLPMLVRSRLRFSPRVARSMLAFGAPLTLSVISVWVLQLSDRYLLALFGDLSQTASYSVAYSLGSVISTIVLAPFSLAWPTAMYSIAKRSDAPRVFQQVFRWFTAVLLFAAFGLSLASTVLLTVLFPPSYRAAAPVIPVVAASIALYGIYTVVMVGANVRRKTWMTSVFTAVAAVVNVALNLVLIPRYGSMGAAASTFFAYLALVVVAYFANQRIYPVPYEVMRAVFAGLMGIALYYLIAELPDMLSQQLGALGPSLGPVLSQNDVALALAAVGLLVYGVWLYMLLQIRTINFRVNPAIMRRLAYHAAPRVTGRGHSEEAYVRR